MNSLLRIRPVLRTIRRMAPVLILVGVLVALLTAFAVSRLNSDLDVESRALVLHQGAELSFDALPNSVELVWERGAIADRAVLDGGLDMEVNQLRGDRVDVIGVQGTPLVQVVARGSDQDETVDIANAVAQALVDTLNDSGGFGRLEIFEPATIDRTVEPSRLPTLPLAVFAGIVAAAAATLALLALRSPIHSRGDLALASDAENVEEVWIENGPPILGAARSLAERLDELGGEFRLLHSGRGDDMTVALATLVGRLNPRVRFTGFPHVDGDASAASGEPRDVLLIAEGTPSREVAKAEATARRLIATVLVHQELA